MFTAEFIANPYATYEQLRLEGPLHWVEGFRWGGAWLIPRYADVFAGLRDTRLSSKRSRTWTEVLPAEVQGEFAEFNRTYPRWLLFLDRPHHGRLRGLLNKSFTRRMVDALRPRIQSIVDKLLDQVIEAGRMDFITDFAHPLPVAVISEMMGIPPEDQAEIKRWSTDFTTFFASARATLEEARAGSAAFVALTSYFRERLPERLRDPGDDLVSLLVHAEEGGERLTTDEILAQCSLLFAGGHETTRNLLGNGLLALLRHPEQLELLRKDRSLLASAVRELGRYDSAVQFTTRVVAEELVSHGRPLKVGDTVILLIGSANRDSDQFAQPDVLDITRSAGTPLSFGNGPHHCLGQVLASVEAEIAFGTIVERLRDLRTEESALVWAPNPAHRGLRTLPLTFAA